MVRRGTLGLVMLTQPMMAMAEIDTPAITDRATVLMCLVPSSSWARFALAVALALS